jgi:hypothetical protein
MTAALSRYVGRCAGGNHPTDRRPREAAEALGFFDRDRNRIIRRRLAAEHEKEAFGGDQSAGADDNGPQNARPLRLDDCLLWFHLFLASRSGDAPRVETKKLELSARKKPP